MFSVIILAISAFIATNIDDIFLLTLLFSSGAKKSSVYLGHFLGITALSLVSFIGAYGFAAFFDKYIFLLGIVPIILGIRAIFHRDNEEKAPVGRGILSIMLLTISGGGDNIGIYLPIFAGMRGFDFALSLIVFGLMSLLWCFTAQRISSLPALNGFISRYRQIIVPAVFIALGIGILLGGLPS